MSRGARFDRTSDTALVPLGLLVGGVIALCLAVLYPVQRLLHRVSVATILGDALVVPGDAVVVAASLLVVAVGATLFGIVLLFVHL
jgi:hypothetical protein